MTKIRFGIYGSGFMGRTHAEALAQLPSDATLVAVTGGSRAEKLSKRFGMEKVSDVEALISRKDIDAVVIATPHHLHAEVAVRALQAQKHVLVEKPLATNLPDADRMLAASQASGFVLATGYHQRFRPNNRAACEFLRAGMLGDLETVSVAMPSARVVGTSNFGSDWQWWNDPQSVGHLINSFPHAIDLLRWSTGKEIARVTALSRTFLPGNSVEDTTLALAEFSSGPLASLYSSRALPGTIFAGENFRFRMVGSRGLMDLDPYDELRVSDASGAWRTLSKQPRVGHESATTAFGPARLQAYRDQMSAFISAIRGESRADLPAIGNGDDGRVAVAVCQAMLESSRQRCWLEIPGPRRQVQ